MTTLTHGHGDILMDSAKGVNLNRYSKNLEELWEF
jgi:hypothetical protein